MIFSVEQVRSIREGKTTGALIPVAEKVRTGSLRVLRRRVPAPRLTFTDGSSVKGLRPGHVEVVLDRRPDGEELAVLLTVLLVRDMLVDEPEEPVGGDLPTLGLTEARACGYRTTDGAKAAWRAAHPRLNVARFIRFGLGDLRDVPRLVSKGWPDYTADPSRAMFDEPEALSRQELDAIASFSWQEHVRRRADEARRMAARPAGDRLEDILRRRHEVRPR